MVDRPGIEPGLSACKAEVLAVITISPYSNDFDNADRLQLILLNYCFLVVLSLYALSTIVIRSTGGT